MGIASPTAPATAGTTHRRPAVQLGVEGPAVRIVLLLVGLVLIGAYHLGSPLNLSALVMATIGSALYVIKQAAARRVGFLTLLFVAVYLLPFIHIPPYIWFDFGGNPEQLWGLMSNPYMTDPDIIGRTALLGAVAAVGMAFGASLISRRMKCDDGLDALGTRIRFQCLGFGNWLVWVCAGAALSWLSAPQDNLFVAEYTVSQSPHASWNFGSAWMMSYVILTVAFCDCILDPLPWRHRLKFLALGLTVATIVIDLQFLRGNRESVPWVFALAVMYFHWARPFITQEARPRLPWRPLVSTCVLLVGISFFIGAIRHDLTSLSLQDAVDAALGNFTSSEFEFTNFVHGTWSAVLLTPLSVAGDDLGGLLKLNLGSDYLDILLSLPPGFFADALGYVRPLSNEAGPAFDMRYGLGGTHAVVLPFLNFRMTGVFFIAAILTWCVAQAERRARLRVSVGSLSLLGCIAMALPHWLWYGEKYIVNAIILWWLASTFYALCTVGMTPFRRSLR